MAVVELRYDPKSTAWFTTNAAVVLKAGEPAYHETTGLFKLGDGVTALSALSFLPSISSGLVVGTTAISGGNNTRILYNNSGVLGEYLVTGTGTTAVLSTSPTFTTDITSPLIIGGTAVGSTLTLQGTSGNGTSSVAAIVGLVGNNGATNAFNVYNSGQFLIGTSTLAGGSLSQLRIVKGTGIIDIGEYSSGRGAIWVSKATPGTTNYSLSSDTSDNTFINGAIGLFINVASVIQARFTNTDFQFSPVTNLGTVITPAFRFTAPTQTNVTAGVNVNIFSIIGVTKTFSTGALLAQDFVSIGQNTVAFSGASVATLVSTFSIEGAPIQGTNATNTTSVGLLIKAGAITGATTSYGLYANAQTGGTTNYALGLNGNISLIDTFGIKFGTTTGGKIGLTTSDKLGFWNATPIVQPTTSVAASTFAANTSGTLNDTATFDSYTIGQVVKALRNVGILA